MWVGGLYNVCCNTEEEARDAAQTDFFEDFNILSEYFGYAVSYDRLLEFAMKHEDFFEQFDAELCEAQEKYFEENYFYEEDEDEEEYKEEMAHAPAVVHRHPDGTMG